jgi:hypothetical protein
LIYTGQPMEKFILLLKKELLGEISGIEKKALMEIVNADSDLAIVYKEVCWSKPSLSEEEIQNAIDAFERHRLRIKQ